MIRMDENSRAYKIIFIMNKLKKMKDEFYVLDTKLVTLFAHLEHTERVTLFELIQPEFILSDLENGGIGEFWAESVDSYEPVDLAA